MMKMPERKIPNVSMPPIYGGRLPSIIGGPGSMPPITSPGQPRIPGPRRPQLPPWMQHPWTTQPVVPINPPGAGPWQPPGLPGPAPNPWKPSPQPNPYKHNWRHGYEKAIFGDRSVDPRTYDNWQRKMPRWMRKAVQRGGADWRSHLDNRGRQNMHNMHQNLKSRFYKFQKQKSRPPVRGTYQKPRPGMPRPRPPRPGRRPQPSRPGRRPPRPPRPGRRPPRASRRFRPGRRPGVGRRGGFMPPGKTGQYMGYGGGHRAYTGKGMPGKKMPMAGGGTRAGGWRGELG